MINLDKYKESAQEIKRGFMKKNTILINGKTFFFKENRQARYEKGIIPINFMEVLSTEMLNILGAKDFVKYQLASFNGKDGSLSKSFIDKSVKHEMTFLEVLISNYLNKNKKSNLINSKNIGKEDFRKFKKSLFDKLPDNGICDFSINFICENVNEFCKNNNIAFNTSTTQQRLKEMIVYDYFLCNNDHNWTNIDFLIKESPTGNKMELTPYFDYSESFDLFFKVEKDRFKPHINSRIAFEDISMTTNFSFSKLLQHGGNLEIDIYNFAKQDKNIAELVKKGINLDIKTLTENLVKKENINFPQDYIDYIDKFYSFRINHYKNTISRLEEKIKNRSQIQSK